MHAGKRVRRVYLISQIRQHVIDLLGEITDVAHSSWIRQGRGSAWIAARRPADAEINPSRIQRLQHTKGLCYFQGAVMREHHAATADTNRIRAGGNLTDHDLRRSAGKAWQVVMLGHPETLVAQLFSRSREFDSLPQSITSRAALAHGRLIDNTES